MSQKAKEMVIAFVVALAVIAVVAFGFLNVKHRVPTKSGMSMSGDPTPEMFLQSYEITAVTVLAGAKVRRATVVDPYGKEEQLSFLLTDQPGCKIDVRRKINLFPRDVKRHSGSYWIPVCDDDGDTAFPTSEGILDRPLHFDSATRAVLR